MKVPDLLDPFVGWKGLHANREGQLYSPQEREYSLWSAGVPFEARCDRDPDHDPPVKGCTCGVYAVRSFEALKKAGYNWEAEYQSSDRGECVAVVAEVKLWGGIRTGTIGYRAQFAYPLKVYVPAWRVPLSGVIRKRYGCALGIINRFSGERR